jgi:hypothetical protein
LIAVEFFWALSELIPNSSTMSNVTATTSATNQNACGSRLVWQQQAKVLSQKGMETGRSSVSGVIAPSEPVTKTIIETVIPEAKTSTAKLILY